MRRAHPKLISYTKEGLDKCQPLWNGSFLNSDDYEHEDDDDDDNDDDDDDDDDDAE